MGPVVLAGPFFIAVDAAEPWSLIRMSHPDLVTRGSRWLQRQGFGVVATELESVGCREQPDVIGFRTTCAVVIEVKVSRADFLADRVKPHRKGSGVGLYRFFLCPADLISPDELPARWGLLFATGRTIREVVKPAGNMWPGAGNGGDDWKAFQHQPDSDAERALLYSAARRLAAGTRPMVGRSGPGRTSTPLGALR